MAAIGVLVVWVYSYTGFIATLFQQQEERMLGRLNVTVIGTVPTG
jgi:hypothetical protein